MRKLMLVFVTAASLLTITACGKKNKPATTPADPAQTTAPAGEGGSGDSKPDESKAGDTKPDDSKAGGW